jgi:phosphoglycerate dehydrogenase-like enzyme
MERTWVSEKLRIEFPQVETTHLTSYEGMERHLADAEIAIAWSLRPEQFQLASKLRWIHSPAAAVHQLLFPELVNSDVVLTNASAVHAPVVAEHVIAQMFALAKQLPQALRLQQKHVWGQETMWRRRPRPRELMGATLGLIGLGSIGRGVAERASLLGMRVIAIREHADKEKPPGVHEVLPNAEIEKLIAASDFVVLAVPLTPETRGLMNASRISALKPEAFLINIGRGALVDESALTDALQAHRVGGAALDVFEKEPLPPDSPLWDLDNLLITPHTAGLTGKLWERHYALIAENLRRYLAAEPLLSIVDKRGGY